MANGKNIWSIAQVSAQWRFRSEVSYSYELNFHVLANFVYDVVIGTAFLQSTETMSVYRNRLSWTPRPTSALAVRNVNLLGDPNQRLRGKLNGELASALPDTGAEPNLVSWDYAKRRGWVGHSLASSRSLLQFPDGSLIEAEGQVRAKWRYDYGQGVSPSSFITFEVVRDLRFDIVLGQDFLEDTDAYTSHAICFYEARTKDQPIGFCLVIWYSRKAKQNPTNSTVATPSPASREKEAQDELERRATNNHRIRREKNPGARQRLQTDEDDRIAEWKRRNPDIWQAPSSNSSQQSSSFTPPAVNSSPPGPPPLLDGSTAFRNPR